MSSSSAAAASSAPASFGPLLNAGSAPSVSGVKPASFLASAFAMASPAFSSAHSALPFSAPQPCAACLSCSLNEGQSILNRCGMNETRTQCRYGCGGHRVVLRHVHRGLDHGLHGDHLHVRDPRLILQVLEMKPSMRTLGIYLSCGLNGARPGSQCGCSLQLARS